VRRAVLLAAALALAGCGEDDLKSCASLRQSDPARALSSCDRALANHLVFGQRRVQAFIERGVLHAEQKNWEPAIADFGNALAMRRIDDPGRVLAHYQRGVARLQKGESDAAIVDFGEALRIDPRHARAHLHRAAARLQKRDPAGALADLNAALQLEPASLEALLRRVAIYEERREYDRGFADLDRAERLAPKNAVIVHWRGLMRARKGELEPGLADVNRAIALNPKLADAYSTRSWIRLQRRELDAAIADADLALALDARHQAALTNRARAWGIKRNFARMLADLEALARLAPESANHRAIGLLHFYLGGYAESAAANAEALRRAPGDAYVALWGFLAQSRMGQGEAAQAALLAASAKLPLAQWPGPVVDHYLGRLTETQLFAAAADADAKRRVAQLCEANFYAAMAKVQKNQVAQALPQLQAAERECPRDFAEYDGATIELKRLGK